MSRFIKDLLVYAFFGAVFYITALIITGYYLPRSFNKNLSYHLGGYGHLYTRLKEVKIYKDVDVLILGSSHAYRGFDTRLFRKNGIKVFNLGSSAQTPLQTEILVKRYIKKLNPKLVIYEVYPGSFCSDGIESAVDLISNDNIGIDIFIMTLKLHNIKVFNTFIFSLFNQIFNLNKDFTESAIKDKDCYVKGGYVEKELVSQINIKDYKASKWKFIPDQYEIFKKILFFFKQNNINYILVQAPYTHELYNSHYNNDEIDRNFDKLGNYYNFNNLLVLPTEKYFYDSNHLNQDGVTIFNQKLIPLVKTYLR